MKHILFLLYSGVLLCFALFTYLFIDQNLFYIKNLYTGFSVEHRIIVTSLYIFFVLFFFLFYFVFLWMAYKQKVQKKELFWVIGVTVGIFLFTYPAMLSYDIFNYITTAKVAFFYHENPYVIMPTDFVGEPFLSFTRAANKIALYAPVWILLTAIPFFLSFGNFIFMLFSFKVFVSVFYIATVALLWKMTKNTFSVAVFALNPLVVIETIVSGHNDIVMMFFSLLSFFFLKEKRIFWALLAMLSSIFIKYATIFLIPVFLYCVWQIYKDQKLEWEKIYFVSALLMLFVFFLAPIREEIYPWYAIWFISFISLSHIKKFILCENIIFSFSLLFSYIPYMFVGTYLAPTPILKNVITFVPIFLFSIYYVLKKKI